MKIHITTSCLQTVLSGFIIPHSLVLVPPQRKGFPKFLFMDSHSLQGASVHRCACTWRFCFSDADHFHLISWTTRYLEPPFEADGIMLHPGLKGSTYPNCSTMPDTSCTTWQARLHVREPVFACSQNIKAKSLKDHFKTEQITLYLINNLAKSLGISHFCDHKKKEKVIAFYFNIHYDELTRVVYIYL